MTKGKKVVLTGTKSSGIPHIGNYFGAIKPALAWAERAFDSYYFIADYHALTTVRSKQEMSDNVKKMACAWLACGLDPKSTTFYRQSDIPEVFELACILGNVTPKGLMNRAHAYKASVADNIEHGRDADYDINIGLYTYPVLMAADIILFNTNLVPVGKDQKQHVEIAADIAQAFNAIYGKVLVAPEAHIEEHVATIMGLDGQKMSKSYGNVIPLFASEDELLKCIKRIKTDSSLPSEPKPITHTIFELYKLFAPADKVKLFQKRFKEGISWADAKNELYAEVNRVLTPIRDKYNYLINNYNEVEKILREGAEKARVVARETLARVRAAIGARV